MPKIMHGIVLFIEPSDDAFFAHSKIGHLFMNRFAIDEDAGFEILNVLELEKSSFKMSNPLDPKYKNYEIGRIVKVLELEKTSMAMSYPEDPEYKNFENDRKQKGIDIK